MKIIQIYSIIVQAKAMNSQRCLHRRAFDSSFSHSSYTYVYYWVQISTVKKVATCV